MLTNATLVEVPYNVSAHNVNAHVSCGAFPTNGLEASIMENGKEDKVKGTANKAAGNVKEAVGKATGSSKTEAKGKLQQAQGELQKGKGDAKDKLTK